ncbi:MAG: glycogen synthase [Candidatus Competibacterales bacterium]
MSNSTLAIAYLTTELTPFAKVGGLADVSTALVRHLHRRGHRVWVFLPGYRDLPRDAFDPGQRYVIPFAHRQVEVTVHCTALLDHQPPVYVVDCPAFYHRSSLYTQDADEPLRAALLTRSAITHCIHSGLTPQIVHCNDWPGGLTPLDLKRQAPFSPTPVSLLAIHNLGYQGDFTADLLVDLDLGSAVDSLDASDLQRGRINFLKTGLRHADALVTVSPTYAREICTAEYGMGLEGILQARRQDLTGILNGVDYGEWNPATDPHLAAPYDADSLDDKRLNKAALLQRVGLPDDLGPPLVGVVSRLASQKGFDLMAEVLPTFLARRDFRLVVLGSGEAAFEELFAQLQATYPDQVRFHRGFDNALAHLIEGGADAFLMPSRYEPCGLNQMYSLRYGTIPLVRRTGGLADTVVPFDAEANRGTGVVFEHYDATGLAWGLNTVLKLYREPERWRQLQTNAMAQDFSWDRQGAAYEDLYRRLVDR